MASYGDKRNRLPGCRVEACAFPGTTLSLRLGVLGWYCEEHTERKK